MKWVSSLFLFMVIFLVVIAVITGRYSPVANPEADAYLPQVSFEEPVDYIAWLRARNSKPDAPDAETVYADWLVYDKQYTPVQQALLDRPENLYKATVQPWADEEYPEVAAWLDANRESLAGFEAVMAVPDVQWWRTCNEDDLFWRMGYDNTPMMNAFLGLLAADWRTDSSGKVDPEKVIKRVENSFTLARHFTAGIDSMSYVRGMSYRACGLSLIRNGLSADIFSPQQVVQLREILKKQYPPVRMEDCMLSEWALILHSVQVIYPGGVFSREALDKTWYSGDLGLVLFRTSFPGQITSSAETWFRPCIDASREGWSASIYQRIRELDYDERRQSLTFGPLLPSQSFQYFMALRLETERRAILILLGLMDCHNQTNEWPASLEACKPLKGLAECLVDPWSGKLFVYRLVDGKPLLYSVSQNERDDQGVPGGRRLFMKTGDAVFWPPHKPE